MFSDFGAKITGDSGILRLMDDLGRPVPPGVPQYALGGGNPAQIAEIETLYRSEMERIMAEGRAFEDLVGRYDGPQGRLSFIEAVATYFSECYGWPIDAGNVAVLNGSQSACFFLFNLFAGTTTVRGVSTKRTILFPLVPEYIGYADQGIEPDMFASIPSRFESCGDHTFKYFVDFERLDHYLAVHPEVAALCVSRPTNPTGNVLTDSELRRLGSVSRQYNIPLIIDNAYGLPWPHIIFSDGATPYWDENIVLSMSLSKIGLPGLRTGIVIAKKEIVSALSTMNSIVSLASGGVGQALATRLIQNGTLVDYARRFVRPFYERKNRLAQEWIHRYFSGGDYAVHKGEGSIFLWLLMRDLDVPSKKLYALLKERGVVVVPGEYFFFGLSDPPPESHPHYNKCIRINYASDEAEVEQGIKIISEVYKAHRR